MGQWWGQLIDQFPMAAVVVNCPPFKGALTACHPYRVIHRRHAEAVTPAVNRAAVGPMPH
jgi:hypothetical protein